MENKKLRLLVTQKCPNNCALCCNKQFNLQALPIVSDYKHYEEIMLTGGEPLLFFNNLEKLIKEISQKNNKIKIFVYTSVTNERLYHLLQIKELKGITLTPHNSKALNDFIKINNRLLMLKDKEQAPWTAMSLRLVLFNDIERMIPKDTDLTLWHTKKIKWLEDCPLPKGEDFMRLNDLW